MSRPEITIIINKIKFCIEKIGEEAIEQRIVNFFKENKIDYRAFKSHPHNKNTVYSEVKYEEDISTVEKLRILSAMIDRSKDWISQNIQNITPRKEEKNSDSNKKNESVFEDDEEEEICCL